MLEQQAESTGKDGALGKGISVFEMRKMFFARHNDNCKENLGALSTAAVLLGRAPGLMFG